MAISFQNPLFAKDKDKLGLTNWKANRVALIKEKEVLLLAPVSRTIFREKLGVFRPVKFKEKAHSLFF